MCNYSTTNHFVNSAFSLRCKFAFIIGLKKCCF